jgi:hypothetical protein
MGQAAVGASTGAAQGGGNAQQLAQQAKQLLTQAQGMVGNQGGQNAQGAQNSQSPQTQQQATQLVGQLMGGQNSQQPGQAAQDPIQALAAATPEIKGAVIQQLMQKADSIIGGGAGQNSQAPQNGANGQNNPMNQLANAIFGNNPTAQGSFTAQLMIKPNLPAFQAA